MHRIITILKCFFDILIYFYKMGTYYKMGHYYKMGLTNADFFKRPSSTITQEINGLYNVLQVKHHGKITHHLHVSELILAAMMNTCELSGSWCDLSQGVGSRRWHSCVGRRATLQ